MIDQCRLPLFAVVVEIRRKAQKSRPTDSTYFGNKEDTRTYAITYLDAVSFEF